MDLPIAPLVVQYLYVHDPGESFYYPTSRAGSSAIDVAARYLECALTQAASLALRDVECELALAINIHDRSRLGRRGGELLDELDKLDVLIIPTEYLHRPPPGTEAYVSSRYVLDAILTATENQPPDRQLWLTDLDCVWTNPELVFSSAPVEPEIGCIYIGYGPDVDAVGFEVAGHTRRAIGEIARSMGGKGEQIPGWVGGELLTGRPAPLRELVSVCEELDARLTREGMAMPNEEQILSLAGATERIRYRDLSAVAWRISTGPRKPGAGVEDPLALGLWHLPAEKGLSLRRTAQQICRGQAARVRRDLSDTARMARRFNVAGTSLPRRLRDDGWLVTQRLHRAARRLLRRDTVSESSTATG